MHTKRDDRKHLKDMITEKSKVYDSIQEYSFERKENLKLNSAHDYSYENGSYSFEIKYTVKAEPTVLQKTFMCSNCLTLRHYYS
jgi:hypothetical protein